MRSKIYTSAHKLMIKCLFGYLCTSLFGHSSSELEGEVLHQMPSLPELSGVPAKSRWAFTVGTYISPQGKAIRPNDETHQSSSQPCLTCPSVLFMVAYPWRKNAYGRGALWSPVGTCVHSQQWRAFKVCSAQLVQCTRLVGGCGLISLWAVSLLCMHLGN